MQDGRQERPLDLGLFGREAQPAPGPVEIAAAVLGLLWLGAVGLHAASLPEGTGFADYMLALLAALLPLAFLWLAVMTARTVRVLRQDAARLQAAVDSMRHAYVAQQQAAAAGVRPAAQPAPAAAGPATERRTAATASVPAPRPAAADDQPGLAFGTPVEDVQPPLPLAEVIAALNFPSSEDDAAAIRALRAALDHRGTAKLIRSAQDVLTLLSQDGIYMDDLHPGTAAPPLWRRFAQGERGRAIAGLGGLEDAESLARTAARMREDPVFRDAAHHFLRQFDRTFQDIERTATDAEIAALADTRTARAFLLFGRVSGTFD